MQMFYLLFISTSLMTSHKRNTVVLQSS